jgi:DNA-binding beta-propeller fold protein YncE
VLSTPSALAVDTSGNLWVANSGNSTVTVFVGAADPVVTPLSVAAENQTQGVKP